MVAIENVKRISPALLVTTRVPLCALAISEAM
jgi:hypothetical protein